MAPPPAPPFIFTHSPTLSPFNVSAKAYLSSRLRDEDFATGALVFDAHNRILLLQRAAHDSMPNRWEVPGGAVDDDDESILHGVARELWEESGLKIKRVERLVGLGGEDGYVFETRRGLKVRRFSFVVDVELNGDGKGEVTLDPDEHQRFSWASEEECRRKKVESGGEVVAIEFTTEAQEKIIMEGFQLRKEAKGGDP